MKIGFGSLVFLGVLMAVLAIGCGLFDTPDPLEVTLDLNVEISDPPSYPILLFDVERVEVSGSDEVGRRFKFAPEGEEEPRDLMFLWEQDNFGVSRNVVLRFVLPSEANFSEANTLNIGLAKAAEPTSRMTATEVVFVSTDGTIDTVDLGGGLTGEGVDQEGTVLEVNLIPVSRAVLKNLAEIRLSVNGYGALFLEEVTVGT